MKQLVCMNEDGELEVWEVGWVTNGPKPFWFFECYFQDLDQPASSTSIVSEVDHEPGFYGRTILGYL